jgi:hypothetical protein
LWVVGVRVALAAKPVPERRTGEPVTPTLALMVTEPVAAPTAVGENTTVMVQVPGASVPVQVPPALANGAVTATVIPVKLAAVIVEVRVCRSSRPPRRTPAAAGDTGSSRRTGSHELNRAGINGTIFPRQVVVRAAALRVVASLWTDADGRRSKPACSCQRGVRPC